MAYDEVIMEDQASEESDASQQPTEGEDGESSTPSA